MRGQSLIELLVTIGLAAIILPAMLTGFVSSRSGRAQQEQRITAIGYLREGEEAVRVVREHDWSAVATDGVFHPVATASAWILSSGQENITGTNFTRKIEIGPVRRNPTGEITASGGILDPSTKKIVITVSWSSPLVSSVTSTVYLTRFDNKLKTETSVSDFNPGLSNPATTGVVVTNTDGGEVTLGAGAGGGDWCDPTKKPIYTFNLPGQGITTAISATTTATMDFAYTTTGGNASGDSMDSVNITNSSPPVMTNGGSYNYRKTYGIYVDIPNQHVYLTSDHPNMTVDIVDVSTKPYAEIGTFLASNGGTGTSVYVAYNSIYGHDVGYVTAGNYFYTFDLTNKTGPRTQLGLALLTGTGKRIVVIGNYAYVAVSDSSEQLNIFDITDPTNPTKISKINLGNNLAATDVFVKADGTRAYVVTAQGQTPTNDFFIVDTSSKILSLPAPIAATSSGIMNPTGVTVVPNNRAVIVGSGGQPYQVFDITKEDKPKSCGGWTPSGATAVNAVAGIKQVDADVFSYVLTNNAGEEFQIVTGGPGSKYASSGVFESQTFNAGHSVMFNYFTVDDAIPLNTTLRFQLGIADGVNGDCNNASFSFIGPDGTSSSYYSTGSTIPFSLGKGQCLRYRAYFSTLDPTGAAVLYGITFNYSP